MIERLLSTLRLFADQDRAHAMDTVAAGRAAGDFLDAYRLIVDCPQYELGATARAALDDMQEVAERLVVGSTERDAAGAAARRALAALGESPR